VFHYWNDTTCIHCDNLNTIAQQITHLLEPEGFSLLNELPPYPDPDPEQIPYIWKLGCPIIIALFPGQGGWTIVKTFPFEFLCERATGASRPRLSALAIQLGCDAFYLGVYERIDGMLLEANVAGRTFVSGCYNPDIRSKQFFDEQIDDMELISGFSLLEVSESLQAAIGVNQEPEYLKKQAKIERLRAKAENPNSRKSEDLWIQIGILMNEEYPFNGHTARIDRALAKAIDVSNCWYWNGLVEDIYTNTQKISAKGAKLLYFRSRNTYEPRQRYTLTEAQYNEIYGIEESDDAFTYNHTYNPYNPPLDDKEYDELPF
jgi:hypothetical protein